MAWIVCVIGELRWSLLKVFALPSLSLSSSPPDQLPNIFTSELISSRQSKEESLHLYVSEVTLQPPMQCTRDAIDWGCGYNQTCAKLVAPKWPLNWPQKWHHSWVTNERQSDPHLCGWRVAQVVWVSWSCVTYFPLGAADPHQTLGCMSFLSSVSCVESLLIA